MEGNDKIVLMTTVHTQTFKVLISTMKESIPDGNFVFVNSDTDKNLNNQESNDEADEVVTKKTKKTDKKKEELKPIKKIVKRKKIPENDAEDDEKTEGFEGEKQEVGGVKMFSIDKNRTLLVMLRLFPNAFSKFYCAKKEHEIGIDLAVFDKLLKPFTKDHTLTLSIDAKRETELLISAQHKDGGTIKSTLKIMDVDTPDIKEKEPQFDIIVTMPSSEFHKICKNMSEISEFIEIICSEGVIKFGCCGDTSKMSFEYKPSNEIDIKLAPSVSKKKRGDLIVQNIYDLKAISIFAKCGTIADDVQILLKSDFPMFVRYAIGDFGYLVIGYVPIVDVANNQQANSDDRQLSEKMNDDTYYSDSKIKYKN